MDQREGIRGFLTSCRAKVTPEEAGVPAYGGKRRVPGLRREEVAFLAGISVDYYTRLERGNLRGVSDGILNSVASVLRLDEAERSHLFDMARMASAGRRSGQKTDAPLRASIGHLVDALAGVPACVYDESLGVLAASALFRLLHKDAFAHQEHPVNLAKFIFLDPRSRDFFLDWPQHADNAAAVLCTAIGRSPHNEELSRLVGELLAGSGDFRARWHSHDVRLQFDGPKSLRHPEVGQIDLVYERMTLLSAPWLTLLVLVAESGSPSAERLKLLNA